MTCVASIAWLRKWGIGLVNRIGSSPVWSWGIIFTLQWDKSKLEQLDGATQDGFELLSKIIDQYQQIDNQDVLFSWKEEIIWFSASKRHKGKAVLWVN